MFRFTRNVAIAALLLLAPSAFAWNADPKKDSNCEHLSQIQKDADQENSEAQTQLGWEYFLGKCLQQNTDKAKTLLSLAAASENVKAMALLGVIYHRENEDAQAIKWAQLAADHGDGGGESLLGWLYYLGKGAPKNDAAALKWAHLAADKGIAGGQSLLGMMYEYGSGGLSKDYVEADKWYILASKSESDNTTLVSTKRLLEDGMTAESRQEAQQRADSWKPLHN